MNISFCTDEQAAQWDDFVLRHDGTYCHRYSWGLTLRQGYGLKTFYLIFEDNGEWKAILPFALLPWPLHKKAVSLPYACYGGIIPTPSDNLFPLLAKWMRENAIHSLELRYLTGENWHSHDVTMIRKLPGNEAELLASLSSDERRKLKITVRNALEVRWGTGGLENFYAVYAANMGRLGTPIHSRKFLQTLVNNYGDRAKLITVSHNAQIIGGMLLVCEKEVWSDPFVASLWQYRHLQPTRLLYHEAMAAAIRERAVLFDFGRTRRYSGTWEFKRRMKANERGINYITLYSDGSTSTSGSTQVYYGKMGQTVAKCWSYLPSGLQNTLGPFLRKYIP